jgi:hypothetical protein
MLATDMILMRQTLIEMLDKIIAPVEKTWFDTRINDFITIHSEIPDDDFIPVVKYLHNWLLECPREEREEAYNLIFITIGQKLRLDNLKHLTQKIKWVKSSIDNPDVFMSILESDLDVSQYANWNIEQLDLPENALSKSESEQTLWAINDIPRYREESYMIEKGRYDSLLKDNSAPSQTLVQNIIREIADRANKRYSGVLHGIYNTWLTTDFIVLAEVLGIFDFIKEISNTAVVSESSTQISPKLDNKKPKPSKGNKSYSLRQVCIAYHFMGGVTKENAAKLLKLHTTYKSVSKLLQKANIKRKELTALSEHKSTDTKHLKDLLAAKRLISGKKKPEALKLISDIISQFQAKYDDIY